MKEEGKKRRKGRSSSMLGHLGENPKGRPGGSSHSQGYTDETRLFLMPTTLFLLHLCPFPLLSP